MKAPPVAAIRVHHHGLGFSERKQANISRMDRRKLRHLIVGFAEQLARNVIGDELEYMTDHELRAAVMLYVVHL